MNQGKPLFSWITAGCLCLAQAAFADTPHWPHALSGYVGDSQACIAIYVREDDQYLVHNLEQCEERLAPCSTFKIPNALIGLETGVLSGPGDRKTWDGTVFERKVLNQDHDLASAIRDSVVWYFQEVALDVGAERMQRALDSFDYGNRDISGGQDRFWLSSSLRISALEQIRFMRSLDDHSLPADPGHQAMVVAMMRQQQHLPESFSGALYGKTGSCSGPEGDHGWFTGFLHSEEGNYVFAVNVKGPGKNGWDARKLAVDVLQELRR
jgi:beta-lactamase class D